MLDRYKNFLDNFDDRLADYFDREAEFIKCKIGCSLCCEIGEFPFSRLEAEYLMSGFINLPIELKEKIRNNIKVLKETNPKMYSCPFLVDKKCALYEYRGIVCRVHGLAWYDETEDKIRLPYCVNKGLNYSNVFDRVTGEVYLQNPVKETFRIDTVLRSELAEEFDLECGEIRPLIKWF